MLTIILALTGAAILGGLVGRRPGEKRCGAYLESYKVTNEGYSTQHLVHAHHRCKERSDPRCQASYCTLHCRESLRCNALCLRALESVTKELME